MILAKPGTGTRGLLKAIREGRSMPKCLDPSWLGARGTQEGLLGVGQQAEHELTTWKPQKQVFSTRAGGPRQYDAVGGCQAGKLRDLEGRVKVGGASSHKAWDARLRASIWAEKREAQVGVIGLGVYGPGASWARREGM